MIALAYMGNFDGLFEGILLALVVFAVIGTVLAVPHIMLIAHALRRERGGHWPETVAMMLACAMVEAFGLFVFLQQYGSW